MNLDSSSGCGINSERANNVHTKCNFCGGVNHYTEKSSKKSDRKREKLVQLVIPTTYERNVHLEKF